MQIPWRGQVGELGSENLDRSALALAPPCDEPPGAAALRLPRHRPLYGQPSTEFCRAIGGAWLKSPPHTELRGRLYLGPILSVTGPDGGHMLWWRQRGQGRPSALCPWHAGLDGISSERVCKGCARGALFELLACASLGPFGSRQRHAPPGTSAPSVLSASCAAALAS